MADTVRMRIKAGLLAAFNADANKPAPAESSRSAQIGADECPRFVLRWLSDKGERVNRNDSLRTAVLRVECYVAGPGPQDEALEPLLAFAVKTIYAEAASGTTKALYSAINGDQVQWEVAGGAQETALAALDVTMQFAHQASDPTVAK